MTTTFYAHWRDVPESAWRWPNFSPAEIACRGTGKLLLNEPALDKLQALRDRLGKPLIAAPSTTAPSGAPPGRSTWTARLSTSPCRTTTR